MLTGIKGIPHLTNKALKTYIVLVQMVHMVQIVQVDWGKAGTSELDALLVIGDTCLTNSEHICVFTEESRVGSASL